VTIINFHFSLMPEDDLGLNTKRTPHLFTKPIYYNIAECLLAVWARDMLSAIENAPIPQPVPTVEFPSTELRDSLNWGLTNLIPRRTMYIMLVF